MGLDFSLYKKRKDQTVDDLLDSDNIEELAYGRKSWELVRKLATNDDVDEGYGILTKESWESLMKEIDPIGDLLHEIDEAYNHYDYYLEHYDDELETVSLIFTNKDKKLIAQYQYWYDRTFDETPVLGYDFSVGYMQSFYDAKDRVREVLEDPDSEVLMSISY
jgi:hypothetical protein